MKINFIIRSFALILCGILSNAMQSYSQDKEEFAQLFHKYKTENNLSSISDYWTNEGLDILMNSDVQELSSMERRLVYSLIGLRLNKVQDADKKEGDVYFLVNYGLTDEESANAYHVINLLKQTSADCFNQASINRLSNLIVSQECSHIKELIKLSGRIGIESLIPFYQSILDDRSRKSVDINWTIRLAMGKMGDANQVRYCINKVRSIGINDEVIFYLVPDLLYLNNRLVYDFVLKEILSTSNNCHSTNPDNPVAIPCAYRLIESIAPLIVEFPVDTYESGDIVTDNYETMLSKVQLWIEENIDTYQLKPDTTI